MNKFVATVIVLFCVLFEVGAQPNVEVLSQKFNAYQSTWPKTKLHLVFNQDKFSPGDTAYFKVYFLREDLVSVAGKQLIDLNLVDSSGESKLHFMFNVNNGLGQNQLAIPRTLSAGIYLLTAHSSWMKNFDPALIFKKKIVIVRKNTLIREEKLELKSVAEGGHLIRDISNKVSIRTHRPGSSVQIIDAAGQEILRSTADVNGVASIIFTPMRNASYFVRRIGKSGSAPLPTTEDDGCSLHLTPAGREEPVKILAASPPGSALRNEELIIIVSSRGKIYHTATFRQGTKDFVEIQIPQVDLPEGIGHVSLLNHAGDLLASRDFYSPGEGQVQAKVQAAKHYFQTREKVRLEVSLTDSKGQPVEGEFAVNVLNTGLFDVEKQNSLSDELNIFSGAEERFLVDRSDANWLTSLDNYLISVTEDVPWEKILSKEATKPRFPFTSVVQKSGRAYFADTHEPVPDFTQIMFYLQRSKMRYHTFTQEKGKVGLAIFDVFGPDEFFYLAQTKGKGIPNLKIEWLEEPIKLPRSPVSRETESPDRYASFIAKRRLIDRSYGFYTSPEGMGTDNKSLTDGRDFEDAIMGTDITINVQDYILFPTMEELVKEVIPSLWFRKRGRNSVVRVSLPEPMTATGDPVYIIDGVATKNTAFFLSLKPSDLLTVKIVYDPKKLERLSIMGKNGIVIVQTKKGDAREPLDDPSKLIAGINRPVNFKVRDYSGAQNPRRPDFRSTVYWNPSVKTDSNGKATVEFFCSDDIGKLSIRIDGLATGGRPFSAGQDLEVVLDPKKN